MDRAHYLRMKRQRFFDLHGNAASTTGFISYSFIFSDSQIRKQPRKAGKTRMRKSKWVAVISAKNHKRQRRKRQSVTAKREKSQTPKVLTAIT